MMLPSTTVSMPPVSHPGGSRTPCTLTTGFTPWAGQVALFAHSYTTEDWSNPDDEDD
jgi:hypothetical protein